MISTLGSAAEWKAKERHEERIRKGLEPVRTREDFKVKYGWKPRKARRLSPLLGFAPRFAVDDDEWWDGPDETDRL